MSPEQQQFIDDLGQLMVSWGLPRTIGRVYGYLLLCHEPANLDEIASELGVAKSGVSMAARQLVQLGLARVSGEPGSRRLRYEPLGDIDAIFTARNAQLVAFLDRLRQGARVAPAGPARDRLAGMSEIIEDFMEEVPALLRQLRDRRRA